MNGAPTRSRATCRCWAAWGAYPAAGTGPTYVSLNIGGADAANFMTGQFVTPGFVPSRMTAAQNSSDRRTQQPANMQVPGLVVS